MRFTRPDGSDYTLIVADGPALRGIEQPEVVRADDHQGAVETLRRIYAYAYGASGATGDDAGHLTAVGMMAKEALAALGGQ